MVNGSLKNNLLIFVRNPELGKVKTRLAATAGDVEALRIYHILLAKTRAAALGVATKRTVCYSDTIEEQDIWNPLYFEKKTQHGLDLGERMRHAFETAFAEGAKKAVIIGSDCPDLNGPLLFDAFEALDRSDFVLGPVHDGGYYLLGMKKLEPSLFEGIPWSTNVVLSETLERIQHLGYARTLLPELSDVDTEADWRDYLKRQRY